MNDLLTTAEKLLQIYSQFELLNFRAHKAIPLTFNKKDSKKLLPQNKRLYFSYRYLNREKTRLTNLILNKTIDVRDEIFTTNKELHPELIDKALKLKNIDDTHNENASSTPRRNRKINKLKNLITLIDDENITLSKGYLTQLIILIHDNKPELSYKRSNPYQPQELLNSLDFRTELLQFDYDRYLYEDFETESYLKYLIYTQIHRIPKYVKSFDAREIVPEAEKCGFSGIAYEIEIDGIHECYVTFKGTEADMDYTERSRRKRMEKYILEGYKDWDYNVNAILIGNNIDLDQMDAAKQFIHFIKDQIGDDCKLFGLGHSLGGHFVQTLQLVYNTFDAGYTMNSAPVQLKQVKMLKPDLLSESNWDKLFKITEDKTITPELNKEIKKLLPRDYPEIINEYFARDLTQIFLELPYTIWVGQKWDYDFTEWDYPFKIHPRQYLSLSEINSYQKFFEELFAYTKDSKTGAKIMRQGMNFAIDRVRQLRDDINKPETYQFFYDYSNYLYSSGIFLDKPKVVTEYLSNPNDGSVWKSSRREWPFLRSLNRDMLDLSIYFHIIYGSKHFMTKKPNSIIK
ncbi:DUF6792 domain-containing protein [Companilactobacillus sp.]|jgi:hypothetical protein|uniref:DUF6792 domain-containing protein n=1 Tax=Companilactobacillus sp. TaxID=2767905 RepID=UPI0025BB9E2D|nr:DUF6792 domain-containing protein [Companilactobacillus sp.]MCH4008665.1 hypothetical protein [Companilactobacillus sp.]MCH4051156.1 hypothetical protein [Companilactobacillus sp.]MCH4076608.1 hypothetical protein [Companilactobacillus sp.]MCH4125183.1 hypothetical protein [Companilactobacillus sp.]MCH4131723.1 hypothetical protein [Companilactobacillus sp.]